MVPHLMRDDIGIGDEILQDLTIAIIDLNRRHGTIVRTSRSKQCIIRNTVWRKVRLYLQRLWPIPLKADTLKPSEMSRSVHIGLHFAKAIISIGVDKRLVGLLGLRDRRRNITVLILWL